MAKKRDSASTTVQREMQALLFLDIKGYSVLSEHELRRFFENILPELARITKNSGSHYWNTWGDAVVCASKHPSKLCQAAMEMRDFFQHRNWDDLQIRPLTARVSLHAGPMYIGTDPFTGAQGMIGTQVNLAARVEPIVTPGQVWATDAFVTMLQLEAHSFNCDDIGEWQLAKAWGSKRLYRIRRPNEPIQLFDVGEKHPIIPANQVRKNVWNRAKQVIQDASDHAGYGQALANLMDIVNDASHGLQPVVRLWGNRGGLEGTERAAFEAIGQELGRSLAERGMAISGSIIHPNTLEYWVLQGLRDQLSQKPQTNRLYLHFNGSESPYLPGESELLYKSLSSVVQSIEIRYPQHDSYHQNAVNDALAYEKSPAHDARLGSLFQCDAVVLVGGNHSARHLVQMLAFLASEKMRVGKPILFLPIPWIGGTAKRAFQAYNGIIEELDFSTLL